MTMFKECLTSIDWSEVYNCENANDSYDIFFTKFDSMYNYCFPLKSIKQCNRNINKPWITQAIL